jgi:hypothetical protein
MSISVASLGAIAQPSLGRMSAPAQPAVVSPSISGTVDRSVSGSMTLKTADGDTVSISASFDSALTYSRTGGTTSLSMQTSRNVSITIDGQLDGRERGQVERAVRHFLHDLRALVRGDGHDSHGPTTPGLQVPGGGSAPGSDSPANPAPVGEEGAPVTPGSDSPANPMPVLAEAAPLAADSTPQDPLTPALLARV